MTNILLNSGLLLLLTTFLNSCTVVGGIFKAGVWMGILIIMGIIVLLIVLLTRSGK